MKQAQKSSDIPTTGVNIIGINKTKKNVKAY